MPLGSLISAVFFLAMSIAALSSLLPMVEVGVRNLMDAGLTRKKSTGIIIVFGLLAGIPSAWNINVLDNQDWVWGVALLVSGLFVSFAMIRHGVEKIRNEDINTPWADIAVSKWWNWSIALFPVFFIFITGWWLWQAITWYPDTWLNPFETFSVGTILLQWVILLAVTLLTNNIFTKKIRHTASDESVELEA